MLVSEDFCELHDAAAWHGQALLEFQDLLPLLLPRRGKFWNVNYLYFESLAAIREGVLCALNGQVHASLAVLRSAVDLFLFHLWWEPRLRTEDDFSSYYEWLDGRKDSPSFQAVLSSIYKHLDVPPTATSRVDIKILYRVLCSYAHKPRLNESITAIRAGNSAEGTPQGVLHWLSLFINVQRSLLDLAVAWRPISLFPQPVTRKFGFNPPVGFFFDESNTVPLLNALGESTVSEYRAHVYDKGPLADQLTWFSTFPDLTDQEILATWPENDPIDDADQPIESRVLRRSVQVKAQMRATTQGFSYSANTPSMEDLGLLFPSLMRIEDMNQQLIEDRNSWAAAMQEDPAIQTRLEASQFPSGSFGEFLQSVLRESRGGIPPG